MTRALALCPSPPHRGILGLVRAAMGCTVDRDAVIGDLGRSDPQDLVRIATMTYVHVIVHDGFAKVPELADAVPDDLVVYFSEMRQANQRRNQSIRAQLADIDGTFRQAGLTGVALKGAAELLAPLHPDPAARFLSDLDILLPAADLQRAVVLFQDQGAVSQEEDEINQRGHHHLEPLWHREWPVPLELHRGFGPDAARGILPADAVAREARATGLSALCVPSPAHRLAHAVLHAQISPPRYHERALSLRDLVEVEAMMRHLTEGEIAEARTCFETNGALEAWEAFHAARDMVFGDGTGADPYPAAARAWAEHALTNFGRPGRRQWALFLRLARYYSQTLLFDSERRRHYARQLLTPGRLRWAVDRQIDKFRRTR